MSDLAIIRNTAGPALPALIAGAGDRAVLRFLEYFTVVGRVPRWPSRITIRRRNGSGCGSTKKTVS
jgi:hypothetical protein